MSLGVEDRAISDRPAAMIYGASADLLVSKCPFRVG